MNEESSGERVRRRTDMSRAYSNVPIGLTAIAGLLLAVTPVAAQSPQDQKLLVTAIIGDLCTVTAASLDFGSGYDASSAVHAAGDIEIECVTPVNVGVALDGGLTPTGGEGTRTMKNGASTLLYNLYSDGPQTNPWATNEVVQVAIDGAGSVPVFGTIPQQGNGHEAGLHTDEVTITLHF
jgi:spore coat protein U-like protein